MKLTFYNEVIQLDYELGTLIASSEDPMFANYLIGIKNQLQSDPKSALELRKQVISNYDIYAAKMNSLGCPVEKLYFKAIYGNMETPEIKNPLFPQISAPTGAEESAVSAVAERADESAVSAGIEETASAVAPTGAEETASTVTPTGAEETASTVASASGNESIEVNTSDQVIQEDATYASTPQQPPTEQPNVSSDYASSQVVSAQTVNPEYSAADSQSAPSVHEAQLSGTYNYQSQNGQNSIPINPYTGGSVTEPMNRQYAGKQSSFSGAPKAEYAVGAIVMSVLGSVFLLTGLVYFAINFLDTFAQGMLMYVVCALVLAFSEFVIRRIVAKLSAVFTAIGISGVFLTTVVNYRSLGNISLPVAAVILGVCAVLVCFFGYIRKSQLYSVIGFLAAFVSSVAIGNNVSATEFMVITLGTLIISTLWLFFPVAKRYDILTPLMILAELGYFLASLSFKIVPSGGSLEVIARIVFSAASWFVVCLVYYFSDIWVKRNSTDPGTVSIINFIMMLVAAFFYGLVIMLEFNSNELSKEDSILYAVILYTVIVVPQIVFAFIKMAQKSNAALTYYISALITGFLIMGCVESVYITVPVISMYSLVARFLAKKNSDKTAYKVVDIVVQSIFAIVAFGTGRDIYPDTFEQIFVGIVLLITLYAGIFINSGYKTAVQIMFVLVSCYVLAAALLPIDLGEAVSMGVVLLFTYVINTFEKFRGRGIKVYNYFMLCFDLLLLTFASNVGFTAEGVFIFCIAAIFGLAFVILMLNKEYGMFFAGHYIAISVYLSFVAILLPIDNGFVLSTILMGIALVSVIIGFALKEKAIRVYGLVLSILVCAKIALLDFVSLGDAMSKTLMYILVGAFALIIGCIYMVLESREAKANKISGQ